MPRRGGEHTGAAAPRPARPTPQGGQAGGAQASEEQKIALVDGSNVAHAAGGPARLRNITLVIGKLREEGLRPVVVADEVVLERRAKRRT